MFYWQNNIKVMYNVCWTITIQSLCQTDTHSLYGGRSRVPFALYSAICSLLFHLEFIPARLLPFPRGYHRAYSDICRCNLICTENFPSREKNETKTTCKNWEHWFLYLLRVFFLFLMFCSNFLKTVLSIQIFRLHYQIYCKWWQI